MSTIRKIQTYAEFVKIFGGNDYDVMTPQFHGLTFSDESPRHLRFESWRMDINMKVQRPSVSYEIVGEIEDR